MERKEKQKKHYYSPVKEFDTYRRPHIFYRLFRGMADLFFPKNEFVWQTQKPADGEAYMFVCNHTKIYAPTYFLFKQKKTRVWANCYFLYMSMCWKHIKTRVLVNRSPKFLLYPIAFLLTPLIVLTFRAFNPIPVFHKVPEVVTMTFDKSMQTFDEGVPQVIFPERTENRVNKYVYQFNCGFPAVAKSYYEKTGKKVKFYPVYCAQKLRKFVVGDPIEYNPDIKIQEQKKKICEYLQDKICEIGESLPPHEPVIYG